MQEDFKLSESYTIFMTGAYSIIFILFYTTIMPKFLGVVSEISDINTKVLKSQIFTFTIAAIFLNVLIDLYFLTNINELRNKIEEIAQQKEFYSDSQEKMKNLKDRKRLYEKSFRVLIFLINGAMVAYLSFVIMASLYGLYGI